MATNVIWTYFVKCNTGGSKAQCNECKKLLSLGSDKPKLQTTSNLKNHLRTCHPEVHAVYMKRASDAVAEESARKKLKVENTGLKFMPVCQPTLKDLDDRRNDFSEDVVKRIDKAIMDMIVVDMLPFSVVEGEAFKRLNFADPAGIRCYNLKSEKFYRTSLLEETYEKVSENVKDLLSKADWVSFTTDVWSNPTKSCSLLNFTGHFVHDACLRKVILSVAVLEKDHTGAYLASKLREAIASWNIESKVHVGVRDNAANMVCAMRVAGITDMGCMAHTLQLAIHDALFTQTSVANIVKKARKIASHFRHSEQACRKLVDCQAASDTAHHKLLQDVETWWNSTYVMLEHLTEQRKAVNLYSIDYGTIDTLTKSEWELAERIVNVLTPFYDTTLEICSDHACVSIMIPLVTMLLGKLQTKPEDVGLQQLKAALRDVVTRRFGFAKETPAIIAATLLDPRFKDVYFSAQEKAAAMAVVSNFLRSSDTAGGTTVSVSSASSSSAPSVPTTTTSTSLWDDHDNMTAASNDITNDDMPQHERQLTSFLTAPRVPRTTDIYQYWSSSQFPLIEPAARKYLSAPPTSVASEQLFSSAGQVYADRRSNLTGENAEKLLFLAYNIRLFGFSY